MVILPAIDIIDQKPVRLYQGDYGKKEQVGESILDIALEFEKEGAEFVHMVDLDGAKEGKKCNQDIICKTAKALNVPVEVGGGIRSMEDVDYYLSNGVARVILGTAALEDRRFLKEAVDKYKDKIAVGIDCKKNKVCTKGWLEDSGTDYIEFAKEIESLGVRTVIVTDIAKDGTMEGPNVEMLKALKEKVNMNIIASGGIKNIEHIKYLKEAGVYGAITGKAMYSKTLDLKEAIKVSREE